MSDEPAVGAVATEDSLSDGSAWAVVVVALVLDEVVDRQDMEGAHDSTAAQSMAAVPTAIARPVNGSLLRAGRDGVWRRYERARSATRFGVKRQTLSQFEVRLTRPS